MPVRRRIHRRDCLTIRTDDGCGQAGAVCSGHKGRQAVEELRLISRTRRWRRWTRRIVRAGLTIPPGPAEKPAALRSRGSKRAHPRLNLVRSLIDGKVVQLTIQIKAQERQKEDERAGVEDGEPP